MDIEQKVKAAMSYWESGNFTQAENLLLEAAHSGSGLAAHNLGTLYLVGGPRVQQNKEQSQHWFEVALASGFEEAIATDPTWFRNNN